MAAASPEPGRWGPASQRFEALEVWSDPAALAVFVKLAACLRAAGYSNREPGPAEHIALFAAGMPVPADELSPHLGSADLEILDSTGAADIDGGVVTPRFAVLADASVLVLFPRPTCFDEVAYMGPDSRWLMDLVTKAAPGGDRAVELGAGNGYLAASLFGRYRFTLATDLNPWTAAVAGITLAMNSRPGTRAAVCSADVGKGIRPASFDLVTGNPPWVPTRGNSKPPRLFADGGPTGFELPSRFILEGSALIAPGGVGIFNCVDARFSNGSRPLRELIQELETGGNKVQIEEVPSDQLWPDRTAALGATDPDLLQARLVSVLVRR